MKVEHSHHVDAGEEDAEGNLDWCYEYELYRFSDGPRTVVARSFTDAADEAHLLRWEQGDAQLLLAPRDLSEPLVRDALEYLRGLGKVKLRYLGAGGYVAV